MAFSLQAMQNSLLWRLVRVRSKQIEAPQHRNQWCAQIMRKHRHQSRLAGIRRADLCQQDLTRGSLSQSPPAV